MTEHEWERLDEGDATCIKCGQSSAWGYGDCVKEEQKTPPPKTPERDTIARDAEIESIKRTLYNAIDKLDRIKRREAELITT